MPEVETVVKGETDARAEALTAPVTVPAAEPLRETLPLVEGLAEMLRDGGGDALVDADALPEPQRVAVAHAVVVPHVVPLAARDQDGVVVADGDAVRWGDVDPLAHEDDDTETVIVKEGMVETEPRADAETDVETVVDALGEPDTRPEPDSDGDGVPLSVALTDAVTDGESESCSVVDGNDEAVPVPDTPGLTDTVAVALSVGVSVGFDGCALAVRDPDAVTLSVKTADAEPDAVCDTRAVDDTLAVVDPVDDDDTVDERLGEALMLAHEVLDAEPETDTERDSRAESETDTLTDAVPLGTGEADAERDAAGDRETDTDADMHAVPVPDHVAARDGLPLRERCALAEMYELAVPLEHGDAVREVEGVALPVSTVEPEASELGDRLLLPHDVVVTENVTEAQPLPSGDGVLVEHGDDDDSTLDVMRGVRVGAKLKLVEPDTVEKVDAVIDDDPLAESELAEVADGHAERAGETVPVGV